MIYFCCLIDFKWTDFKIPGFLLEELPGFYHKKLIPFYKTHITEETIQSVVDVLKSGQITTGPKEKDLTTLLYKFIGVPVQCISSNSIGLEMALKWYGIGPGDEVIIPAITYCATANAVKLTGAKPIIIDVEKNSLISISEIEQYINKNTKAIIPVDIAGMPCEYDEIKKIIKDYSYMFISQTAQQERLGKILLLADAAHSIGATYKDKNSGTLADISVFSFHAVKNITTAEGGAICFNFDPLIFDNNHLREYFRLNTNHGRTDKKLLWEYDVLFNGYKANLADINAVLAIIDLKNYDEILNKRKHIFETYNEAFSDNEKFITPKYETDYKRSSMHLYRLHINGIDNIKRNEIIFNAYDKGVELNVHYKPLNLLTAYYDSYIETPIAHKQFNQEITLPCYYDLTDKELDQIITTVKRLIDN